MITEAEDVRVALLCEYFANLPNPVIVLSVCRGNHDDGTACRHSPIVIFSNSAFPQGEKQHALLYAESCNRVRFWVEGSTTSQSQSGTEGNNLLGNSGLSEDWNWTARTLLNGTVLVVEGLAVSNSDFPVHRNAERSKSTTQPPCSLVLPTPINPKPFPLGFGLDLTSYPTAALEHNALFLSLSWSTSPLGPIDTWDAQLRGTVQTMMASPFPVLVSYGPEYVLLYNEPYSKVIGTKHPSILGMKYDEAWPEIWSALEPVVRAGYQGSVLNVDCQEMFLMRGARLEGM